MSYSPHRSPAVSAGQAWLLGFALGAVFAVALTLVALFWPVLFPATAPSGDVALADPPPAAETAAAEPLPSPTPQPAATSTPSPTNTPTPSPSPTPVPTATPSPTATLSGELPAAHKLTGFVHQWQTWNNCGPATLTTNLSLFGLPQTQADAAPYLKPNRDDKNVSPHELAAYARQVGMETVVRRGGSLDLLKQFIHRGLPVLTETWLTHDGDGLGHYRLVVGYDDSARLLYTSDSLNGPDVAVDYDQFLADWRVFNRLYLVVYSPDQASLVAGILGPDADETANLERVLALAQAETTANPNDAVAWFNQGDALARLSRFDEAAAAFDRAMAIGLHWRHLWYQFTPFETYYTVGRYQDVLDLTGKVLADTGGLEEAYYYRGLAELALGQPDAARADFEAALTYNPLFTPAKTALEKGED